MKGLAETAEIYPSPPMTLTMQPLALFIRQLSIAAALGLALLAQSVFAERGSHIVLEKPLPQPPWELPLIANGAGTIGSSTHDGKVIYVDFWASWCGPCRLSLPALDQISKDFDETDFRVVAISVDYVSEDALDFLDRYPVDYPVAIDTTGDLGRAFAVAGMPSGYLIDRAGRIREIHVGFRKGDEALLKKSIAALLEET
jgi:cytochrome c biogenesis protein CcmG/thiol:disulfide interchange protein DsbE